MLEQLYGVGKLIIHHKQGICKYYALAEEYIFSKTLFAPDPLPDNLDYLKWRVLRVIGAVGLLWNRSSDALPGMKADMHSQVFAGLVEEGRIVKPLVEDVKYPLYFRAEDALLMELAKKEVEFKPRCEFGVLRDCFM